MIIDIFSFGSNDIVEQVRLGKLHAQQRLSVFIAKSKKDYFDNNKIQLTSGKEWRIDERTGMVYIDITESFQSILVELKIKDEYVLVVSES